ncbi:uncharacterized protein LOC121426627 [Lytechinus variegatus]|uniref:uncharacterized protein LOC121426627 n=1 Tax=Lytechinus variegatus TaxID=7654 RepID=UPI001BB22A5A|nr:uncharacterized protein LOC121426627 [Lytechinus variegatus]
MNYMSRAAASGGLPRPSEEVGYLIYCPTMEELDDTCMKELDPENDFEKDDKLHLQTVIALSRVKDEFATIRQSMTSIAGELHLERASSSYQGHHEANRVSTAGSELQSHAACETKYLPQSSSAGLQHAVGFDGMHVAEDGVTNTDSQSSSSQYLGRNRVGPSAHYLGSSMENRSSSFQHMGRNMVGQILSHHHMAHLQGLPCSKHSQVIRKNAQRRGGNMVNPPTSAQYPTSNPVSPPTSAHFFL